ncbi:hypothetical protein AVEN_105169-1 [Araneus ventricosus]|uniref:Uncharacterized protein n=1 Tax=Araneus ventricosus TaxID=182803 RepID=A0A4Y2NGX4_ARAVE|nr:hypothetical protein AVEN_105169-1 [Araneus ventricosus]
MRGYLPHEPLKDGKPSEYQTLKKQATEYGSPDRPHLRNQKNFKSFRTSRWNLSTPTVGLWLKRSHPASDP